MAIWRRPCNRRVGLSSASLGFLFGGSLRSFWFRANGRDADGRGGEEAGVGHGYTPVRLKLQVRWHLPALAAYRSEAISSSCGAKASRRFWRPVYEWMLERMRSAEHFAAEQFSQALNRAA